MEKIIIVISIFLIISCNKENSSKVTPLENEVNIGFETVAIGLNGNLPSILMDTLPSKGIGFHFKNGTDWQVFKSKYLDLFLNRVVYQKNIDFNNEDLIALVYYPNDKGPFIEIKKIESNDSTIMVYYNYNKSTNSDAIDQPYHIVKTKKLDKKIIYIQQ